MLQEELESLFPGSDIVQQKTNVKNNDYDIFLQFAMKKLMYYQDKLAKQDVKPFIILCVRSLTKLFCNLM